MKIKNLNFKKAIEHIQKTSIVKKAEAVAMAATLALTGATTVKAHVNSDDIYRDEDAIKDELLNIGYDETSADYEKMYIKKAEKRADIRSKDGEDIAKYFNQVADNERLAIITEAVEVATELDNLHQDETKYLSTSKKEVLSLDVPTLYDEMQSAIVNDDEATFGENHLTDLAALNAYNYFSSRTVSKTLINKLTTLVTNIIESEAKEIASFDNLSYNKNNQLIIEITTNEGKEKITFDGDLAVEFISLYAKLDNHYNTGLANITDASNESEYEDTFVYNGVDITTGNSAWLALNDYNVREELVEGIELVEVLENTDSYLLDTTYQEGTERTISISKAQSYNLK